MSRNLETAQAIVAAIDIIEAAGASTVTPHCTADAKFACQAEMLKDIKTPGDYAVWSKGFLDGNKTAIFEGTLAENVENSKVIWSAVVWPAGKEGPVLDYVYEFHFDGSGKCDSMTKIWNDKFSLAALGM